VLHAVFILSTWSKPTYWDFGDGNYLYISRRITQGVVLYRDILAPQPPMHFVAGAALARAGDAFFPPQYWHLAFRAFSLLLRSATAVLIFLMAARFFQAAAKNGTSGADETNGTKEEAAKGAGAPDARAYSVGLLAAAIFLFLPIGFWWQLGYQSEPLEIFFLLLAVWGVWSMERRGALIGAGIASALAAHTNMTAAPYFVCNAVFLLCRRPRSAPFYLAPFFILYFAIAFAAGAATDGAFWNNVLFNQAGTFPPPPMLWGYLAEKLPRMMNIVLGLEGQWLVVAAAGIGVFLLQGRFSGSNEESARLDRQRREYLVWSAIGHWLSICFTAKGGTVDYIFTIGEPFVAFFAACGLAGAWQWLRPLDGLRHARWGDTTPFLRAGGFALLVVFALLPPVYYMTRMLARELPADQAERVFFLIDHYTRPGDPLLAPPFYAVMTRRRVAAEYSENFIWTINYRNERRDGIEGPGVAKVLELASMLRAKKIPLVLLDMDQTGRIPEIRAALDAEYHQIESRVFETRNTRLTFWIPRDKPISHLRLFAE